MRFLPLLLVLTLMGCYEEQTNQQLCAEKIATYSSYEFCDQASDCRLKDWEHMKYRAAKIASIKYCALARIDNENKISEEMEKNDD